MPVFTSAGSAAPAGGSQASDLARADAIGWPALPYTEMIACGLRATSARRPGGIVCSRAGSVPVTIAPTSGSAAMRSISATRIADVCVRRVTTCPTAAVSRWWPLIRSARWTS